jgi:hypothetical protein
VALVGALSLLLREVLPLEALSTWSERAVGVVLIGVGLWGARAALGKRVHVHAHDHDGQPHAHVHFHGTDLPHEDTRAHRHGTVAAMALFSAFIGALGARAATRGLPLYQGFLGLCSVAALVVGGYWLWQGGG